MRVFAALPLPGEALDSVIAWMARSRRSWPDLRWVAPGQIHLTLRFFGDIPRDTIARAAAVIVDEALEPVEFTLSRVSCFRKGREGIPGVYWLGGEFSEGLRLMVEPLCGVPDDDGRTGEPSRFVPHLTVARQGRSREAASLEPPAPVSGVMDRIVLMNSTLTSSGPVYEVLESRGLARGEGGG